MVRVLTDCYSHSKLISKITKECFALGREEEHFDLPRDSGCTLPEKFSKVRYSRLTKYKYLSNKMTLDWLV